MDDVSENFSDPDGDELTYTAASSADSVATVSFSGAEVTAVAGVAAGSATVTVTATDPGGLSATQTFDVTVAVPANHGHRNVTDGNGRVRPAVDRGEPVTPTVTAHVHGTTSPIRRHGELLGRTLTVATERRGRPCRE